MTDEVKVLSDDEVAEIAAMFPHAEYQPTLSLDEVDPCEFCKGTIDDHKANCVVPHVHALCATVRALWVENKKLKDRLAEQRTQNRHLWEANKEIVSTNTALREQLAQSRAENERLASQLKQWQEEKDTKAGYL